MRNETYDLRLLIYQGLVSLPIEVLMLDTYSTLKEKDFKSYLAMGLLNAGSTLACLELGKVLYGLFHDTHLENRDVLDVELYASPINFTHYKYFTKDWRDTDLFKAQGTPKDDKLLQYLDSQPSFTDAYMKAVYGIYGAKVGYGAGVAPTSNVLGKALYALSQPLAVILRDSGKIK
jgi:hypothetical protein